MTALEGSDRVLIAIKAVFNGVTVVRGTIASLTCSIICIRCFIVIVLSMVLAGASIPASSSELEMLLTEYPPYYTVKPDGKISGIIVDSASKIFARAGIEPKFSFVPPKRVFVEIKTGAPLASLGWFKTVEREKFAHFSLPVYRNKPEGVFVLREEAERFASYRNFRDLMATSHFTIGRIDGYSQGEYLDTILADYQNRTVWATVDQVQLIQMLKARRFDFILLPPEEMEILVESAGYWLQDFVMLKMDDIPAGILRYIMYSKSVNKTVIEKIDKAITVEIGILEPGQ